VGQPLATDLAPPVAGPVRGVDVLSWNIGIGTGRLTELLTRLRAGEFGGAGSDPARPLVVLVQEAFRADATVPERGEGSFHGGIKARGALVPITRMAEENGLSLRYAPSMRNGGERSDRGNAVLATAAIRHAHGFALPYVKQRRVAVAAELAGLPGLTFVSAHVDTWGRAPGETGVLWRFGGGRAAQTAELARRILARDGVGGVVVGADLNTPLGRRDPAVRAMEARGFVQAAKIGGWGHTFNGPVRFLLDHVLFHPAGGRIRGVSVTRLDEDPADRGRPFGSDHHPLLARVELR
jgi:endonuclease/exonuclease/phosphatase family metal-dependent hydrolase